jgi:1-acyl-sn-glycerol-3-phosphate acyltransferase
MRASELNRWWAVLSAVTMPLVRLLFRPRIEGMANVPHRGPAIIAFNHVSVLDGPVLAIEVARQRRRESRFLVAAELFGSIWGPLLRAYHQIPIRRGQGDARALDEALATVGEGAIVAIAPEGRVSDDGATDLQRVRRGAARLALPTAAPVIPVGIWGTQVRWPRSGLRFGRPWRPPLAIVIGDALVPHGDAADQGDIDAFTERLRASIERQVTRARAIAEDG